jgi:hypothetical protein
VSGDKRQTWGLIIDVIKVLENHGYKPCDNLHTGRAVWLIGDLAHIYEGTQEEPGGGYAAPVAEPRQAHPAQAGPLSGDGARAIVSAEIREVLAALDEASNYKRDRAGNCADCTDQSCRNCEHRLYTARSYESRAARLQQALDITIPERPPPEPAADPLSKLIHPETSEPEAE